MYKGLNIFVIGLLLTSNVFSQSIYFNRLTTEHGLSNNNVFNIIQDRFGFLWFATDDGLNRYDGYDFKIFRNDPENQNSISDNSVWVLTEDKKGNIWIGTKNGWLNRFDPVSEIFTRWKIKTEDVKENAITCVYEDSEEKIWIGTYRQGLYKLDPDSGKLDHWYNKPENNTSISNNYISSILEDNKGNYWISTYFGLNKFNPQKSSSTFKHFFKVDGEGNCISDNIVWHLTQSESDASVIWIGTANGLTKYKTDTETFSQIEIPNPEGLQFGNSAGGVIEEITNNQEKTLWIDSYAGLIRINVNNGYATRFVKNKNDPNSITSSQIHRIFKDRSGVLWLATDKGLSYFSFKSNKFNYLFSQKFNLVSPLELNKKNIKAIAITSDNTTWFGTDEGLYYASSSNGKTIIKQLKHSEKLNVWSLTSDASGNLWIGTYGSGLYRLDLKTNRLIAIPNYEKRSKSQAVKYVKSLCVDNNNNLWMGFWGMGLARLAPSGEHYEGWLHEKSDTSSLSFDDVWVIHQDNKGRIWIGTDGGGLNLFNETDGGRFYCWTAGGSGRGNLSSRGIYSICEGSAKKMSEDVTVLWIGTNNGLNKLVVRNSKSKKEFPSPLEVEITHFTIENGLADNSVKSIVEDDNGNLWLGTGSGISLLDTDKNQFTNFSKTDGVIGGDFNFSAAYKNKDGLIFMGSTEGLNYFYPSDIKLSSFIPPILITDFQIFNKSVEIKDGSPLKSGLFYTKEIILSYTQNVFSFEFAALDYSSPQSIQYSYMMEGFDNDWVNSGSRRFVTYTNLNPGEYTFKVKSTNSDGVWNENFSQMKVVITPPWWQTPWAIGLYALIFILGIWGIVKFQAYRTRLQHELKMQEFEAHHLREIESMKSRFFANLSHEFRTPLTLIKGPLEQLISGRIKDNLTDYYKMLLRNTEKLQNLIDQLLELSQLEAETIPLNKQPVELVSLLRGFTYSFMPLAEQKFISLNFISAADKLNMNLDRDKLEKIINNLLSNAFKFTQSGGKISVKIALPTPESPPEEGAIIEAFSPPRQGRGVGQNELVLGNFVKISVSDTGTGIPEEYQSKIFDRFFRIDDASHGSNTGSGIGLALVKELATLHNWDISVSSKEGEGTIFTLKIPLEKATEVEDEKVPPAVKASADKKPEDISLLIDEEINTETEEASEPAGNPVILFVEDSPDVRSYVNDLLKSDYKVLLAERAEEGIELALENMPDLILSDLMMPGMDGIEFCHRIKTDWQTSHIPVILLTAKATEESKIEGLETGADDYLTKPFNYEELAARIKNLIEQRKRLREKFSKEINIQPEKITSNAVDGEFIQRVLNMAEKNLGNNEFDTEHLAQDLFVSRRQLHRKIQAITGQGPGEFIRIFRLKKAAQMLIEKKFNVTQIALEVGFESPAQFTRAFKKHFNCLPSDFNQNIRHQTGTSDN
jgi:signal transduction histidine kinase/ligand-binding sensor domain-containing protein/DNA-binding response OmpR family regulator